MFIIIYFLGFSLSACANYLQYDQRQIGDVNVQVDLKDIQIFGILKGGKEEYVDYDYAYDYSELTIKPQNRTTPKPFNSTSSSTEQIATADISTSATAMLPDHTLASLNNELTTSEFIEATSIPDKDYTTTVRNYPDITTEAKKNVSAAPIQRLTRKNCRKGYVLNQKGQCQLKINTTENALLRLVKLSQKLKLRRENKNNDNS